MLEQSTVWIMTEETTETVVTEGERYGQDIGGGFGAIKERVAAVVRQRVPVPVETLKQQMTGMLQVVTQLFSHVATQQQTGMELDEVELSVEVNAEGKLSIVAGGVNMGGKGAIKLKFKRSQPKQF